jgi:hypothetical protein
VLAARRVFVDERYLAAPALALEHAAGRVEDDAYLARLGELRAQRDDATEQQNTAVPADRAVAWLRVLGEAV